MKLPRKNKQWAKEAIDSLHMALAILKAENHDLTPEVLELLFKFGPMFCVKNRGIKDKETIQAVAEYAIRQRFEDVKVEPEVVENYSINFLLAYLESHVYLELISENKMDEIMFYITDHYGLEL